MSKQGQQGKVSHLTTVQEFDFLRRLGWQSAPTPVG